MAGTTGLEPATSDMTGRRLLDRWRGFRFIFSSLRGSWGVTFRTATVRATVLDDYFMPVLAYNGGVPERWLQGGDQLPDFEWLEPGPPGRRIYGLPAMSRDLKW